MTSILTQGQRPRALKSWCECKPSRVTMVQICMCLLRYTPPEKLIYTTWKTNQNFVVPFKGVLDSDLQPHSWAGTLGSDVIMWMPTLHGSYGQNMNAFLSVVTKIYTTEANKRMNANKQTNKRINSQTERRKLYTPRHKRGYNKIQGYNKPIYEHVTLRAGLILAPWP